MKEKITKIFDEYNIQYTSEQILFLVEFFNLVIEKNKIINLTSITEKEEFAVKHILDSVIPYKEFNHSSLILDLGSGAGFPGVPLKILRPDLKFVLLDSVLKKVEFLNEVIKKLNFTNCVAVHARVEDFAKTNAEKFDYVVVRAVAKLNTLVEYSLPLVKTGGQVFVYKAQNLAEEINLAKNALKTLAGEVKNVIKLILQGNERNIIILQKLKSCPKGYPRGKNKPKNEPL